MDAHERVDDAVLVVEERLAELVLSPRDDLVVRVGEVATAEDLVAIADRIPEVDRVAARDAVPRGTDVDVDAVEAQDVRGPADLGPRVEREGEVVQASVGTPAEGDVVGL